MMLCFLAGAHKPDGLRCLRASEMALITFRLPRQFLFRRRDGDFVMMMLDTSARDGHVLWFLASPPRLHYWRHHLRFSAVEHIISNGLRFARARWTFRFTEAASSRSFRRPAASRRRIYHFATRHCRSAVQLQHDDIS